jgi:hypothetical protein
MEVASLQAPTSARDADLPSACREHLLVKFARGGEIAFGAERLGEVVFGRERVGVVVTEQALGYL